MSRDDELAALPAILEAFLEGLRADLTTSTGTIPDTGARAMAVRSTDDTKLSTSSGRLVGYSLAEATGLAGAKVYIRDGVDAEAPILAVITLAANESTRDWWAPGGVGFGRGLYVDLVSGQIEGALYLGAVE